MFISVNIRFQFHQGETPTIHTSQRNVLIDLNTFKWILQIKQNCNIIYNRRFKQLKYYCVILGDKFQYVCLLTKVSILFLVIGAESDGWAAKPGMCLCNLFKDYLIVVHTLKHCILFSCTAYGQKTKESCSFNSLLAQGSKLGAPTDIAWELRLQIVYRFTFSEGELFFGIKFYIQLCQQCMRPHPDYQMP